MPRRTLLVAHDVQRWLWPWVWSWSWCPSWRFYWCLPCSLGVVMALTSAPARADGCTVLLCLAGNWRNIHQCVPPVRRALRDLALGRSFPFCELASPSDGLSFSPPAPSGNGPYSAAPPSSSPLQPAAASTVLRWAGDGFCPEQYRSRIELESGSTYVCAYAGAIEVSVGGLVWNRTWWNMAGDTVTEWSEAARRAVPEAVTDDRFERDYLAWRALQPQPLPADTAPTPEGGA
jgi:hypothetical protein